MFADLNGFIKKQQVAGIGYTKDNNTSKIVELMLNGTYKNYSLSGLHLIKLETNKQNISIKIE